MTRIVGGCEPGASGMVGSGMGTVRVRTEERVHVRELACACSAGAGEYWSKQPFAHLFATKCAANATFYGSGSGVTLWISGDTGWTTLLRQRAPRSCTVFVMTPPNEHTSEGGRDDRGVPYHAESALSSAQVLKVER